MNIEVIDDRVLLGAYGGGKIERRLFFINKEQLGLLIDGFISAAWNNDDDCYDTCYEEGDDYYKGVSGIPGAEIYYKQFALPNMPTHWIEIPTHP